MTSNLIPLRLNELLGCASSSVCLFLLAIDFSDYDKPVKEMIWLCHDSNDYSYQFRTLLDFLLTLFIAMLYIFKKGAAIAPRSSPG